MNRLVGIQFSYLVIVAFFSDNFLYIPSSLRSLFELTRRLMKRVQSNDGKVGNLEKPMPSIGEVLVTSAEAIGSSRWWIPAKFSVTWMILKSTCNSAATRNSKPQVAKMLMESWLASKVRFPARQSSLFHANFSIRWKRIVPGLPAHSDFRSTLWGGGVENDPSLLRKRWCWCSTSVVLVQSIVL